MPIDKSEDFAKGIFVSDAEFLQYGSIVLKSQAYTELDENYNFKPTDLLCS